MSYITAIGTANPKYRYKQSQIADFMVRAMQLDTQNSRKLRAVFNASGIEYRHSILEDYGRESDFTFYPNTSDFEPFPPTSLRLDSFRKHAVDLSVAAVDNIAGLNPSSITHLVTVSCTGLYAPGLDIELVTRLGLPTSVQRTAINFMGCYAAFNALKVGDAFCQQHSDSRVLIVCVELCSLHFQKSPTEDNMIANALFGDGAAAVLMENDKRKGVNLRPERFVSELTAIGSTDMAWQVGDLGFEMKLSTYVPAIIRDGILPLTTRMLDGVSKNISDIRYFALHPGGRKILENIEHELGLTKLQNASAYEILKKFGNMSSPTVLFVLAEVMKGIKAGDDGEYILSFAFGPGITLESMLLKIELV